MTSLRTGIKAILQRTGTENFVRRNFLPAVRAYSDLNRVFLASYPKSGRTWLRYAIYEYFTALGASMKGDIRIDEACMVSSEMIGGESKFHFSHMVWNSSDLTAELFRRNLPINPEKLVFIVRDPRSVAVSMFFERRYRSLRHLPTPDNVDSFFRSEEGLVRVIDYLNLVAEVASKRNCCVLKYEALHENFVSEFSRLMHYAVGDADNYAVEVARAATTFDNMRSQELENTLKSSNDFWRLAATELDNPDSFKTRKGQKDSWRSELESHSQEFAMDMIDRRLARRFGYQA